ncbi:putative glycoside hydrolase family 75 protein [Rosellinia necatrix]|uniref:Endo-chitosanase n=1 Tax=Rosellinia necatrix TaxID=77044 RepID=A0A1W2TAU7_ROSNE|nr:putative glycoside hydrolase family 75 protein [Rosellinia necatrix]
MARRSALLALSALVGASVARDVPQNVRDLYNSIKSQGQCTNVLQGGFYALEDGSNDFTYCGDRLASQGIIYQQGTGGALSDMDIDCDGVQGSPADDGRCGNSGDTQSVTSFADVVQGYGRGVDDLDANIHPYVVFGNVGSRPGYANFDPRAHGVEPLSVMAVVCGDQLIYGIWGDENGDDGPKAVVGEASISLATACFGKDITGNNGHEETDVLYIAFPGAAAVPGADGARWDAANFDEFQASITCLGNSLVSKL